MTQPILGGPGQSRVEEVQGVQGVGEFKSRLGRLLTQLRVEVHLEEGWKGWSGVGRVGKAGRVKLHLEERLGFFLVPFLTLTPSGSTVPFFWAAALEA